MTMDTNRYVPVIFDQSSNRYLFAGVNNEITIKL